jgi:hypothetical protein
MNTKIQENNNEKITIELTALDCYRNQLTNLDVNQNNENIAAINRCIRSGNKKAL